MSKPKAATIRRISQGLFLAAFLCLFALTVWPSGLHVPTDLFLRTDPLVVLSALVAAKAWVVGLVLLGVPVVALAVIAGRAYCGWICPMGTTIDVSDWLFFRKTKSRPITQRSRWKYYILAAVLVSALFGAQLAYLVDPIVVLTRTLTLAVFGPVTALANTAVSDYMDLQTRIGLLSRLPQAPQVPPQAYFGMAGVALALFAGILALGSIERRFWCRNLCPLGALLGVVSRIPLLRRRVADNCTSCRRCIRECPTGAIEPEEPRAHRIAECIQCNKCSAVCPEAAVRFVPQAGLAGREARLDLSRRRLLAFGAAGLGWAAIAHTTPAAKTTVIGNTAGGAQLIRPPGALPEPEFLDRCVRCQQCVKACPTNGLQPSLSEAGIDGLWTPVLVPRIGPCSEQCNLCTQVCPTDAIEPIRVEDKPAIFIGQAVIDRSSCIVWADDKQCLVCDEVCPYKAVEQKIIEGKKRPTVNDHVCTGCGECEKNCPVQPLAAIRVFSLGDRRHWGRERQRQWRYGVRAR